MKIVKPIVFFDLETTGTQISESRIVQIAAMKLFPNGDIDLKESLINPGMSIPAEATAIHGKTDEMVKDAPLFMVISKSLLEWLRDCDIGGYNSDNFDIPMLIEEFKRCKLSFPDWDCTFVDVLKNERRLNSHRLGETYKRYTGKELDGAHDAMIDVKATVEILQYQMKANPEMTMAEIDELCQGDKKRFDYAGKMYVNENGEVCWSFGKHVGQPVRTVRHYAQWFLDSDFPQQSKDKLRQAMKDGKSNNV